MFSIRKGRERRWLIYQSDKNYNTITIRQSSTEGERTRNVFFQKLQGRRPTLPASEWLG